MGQIRLECKTGGNLVQPTVQNIFSYEIWPNHSKFDLENL